MPNNRIQIGIDPTSVTLIGGGEVPLVKGFANGISTGEPVMRDGKPVRTLRTATVFIDGVPVEGITVQTTTDIESIPNGSIMRGEGAPAILVLRADARPGFNGGAPRGEIAGSIFLQGLTVVASLDSLLTQADTRRGRSSGGE